ncbi:MAG TPA: hypothetical protein VKP08_08260, partial [Anaerolineales bacterium]|nr:hypothetical protein [Anaerolineales bacterium]
MPKKNIERKSRRIFVFHPFLFAAYSVLAIYSQNASQVPAGWIFRSLAVLLLFTAILYACLQRILKDHQYSGFVTTLFLNWVFMGHLYRFLLEQSSFWRTPLGGICAFLLVSVPLGFLGSRWVWNKLSNPRLITTLFNVVALVLLAYPLWITVNTLGLGYAQTQVIREQQARFSVPLVPSSQSVPDIYLIIVDGYGRADFLMDTYGYNNEQFIEFLKGQGFYVADRATPNYPLTELSIPSMLNFQYLDEYTREFAGTNELSPLYELIQHSASRQLLKDQGYTFVALPSASLLTQIRDADIYFNWEKGSRNEFESLLLSTTIMGVAAEA